MFIYDKNFTYFWFLSHFQINILLHNRIVFVLISIYLQLVFVFLKDVGQFFKTFLLLPKCCLHKARHQGNIETSSEDTLTFLCKCEYMFIQINIFHCCRNPLRSSTLI